MDALNRRRLAQQKAATANLGVPHQIERVWASQVAALGQEAEMAALPLDTSQQTPEMDGGALVFMFGMSAFLTTAGGSGASQDPFHVP